MFSAASFHSKCYLRSGAFASAYDRGRGVGLSVAALLKKVPGRGRPNGASDLGGEDT